MAKNSNYDYEETMVTLTDEDGVDRDFYIDEIYEVDGKTYCASNSRGCGKCHGILCV